MKPLLVVTSVIELGAGLALLSFPSAAVALLLGSSLATPAAATRYVFSERDDLGDLDLQLQGGLLPDGAGVAGGVTDPAPAGPRMNMVSAIRLTLERELKLNPRLVVFGEDVGRPQALQQAVVQ